MRTFIGAGRVDVRNIFAVCVLKVTSELLLSSLSCCCEHGKASVVRPCAVTAGSISAE